MDFILNDFDVEVISKDEKSTLYAGIDDLYYHLMLSSSSRGFNTLLQTHIHRYDLASAILLMEQANSFGIAQILSGNHQIKAEKQNEMLNLSIKWNNTDEFMLLDDKEQEVTSVLTEDMALLRSIQKSLADDLREPKAILKKLMWRTPINQEVAESLTSADLELIAFETTVLKQIKRWKKAYGTYQLYQMMLSQDLELKASLTEMLLENFEFIYRADSCDCGSEGCFFDILKTNQLHFFKDKYDQSNGDLDHDKISKQFDKVWQQAKQKEKVVLLYLYEELMNSTLLNLAFLRSDFDVSYYQHLMCFPYQPDSEDEKFVRLVSTTANYFTWNP